MATSSDRLENGEVATNEGQQDLMQTKIFMGTNS